MTAESLNRCAVERVVNFVRAFCTDDIERVDSGNFLSRDVERRQGGRAFQSNFFFANGDDDIRAVNLGGIGAGAAADLQRARLVEADDVIVAVACSVSEQNIFSVVVADEIVTFAAVYRPVGSAVNQKVIIARAAVDKIILVS